MDGQARDSRRATGYDDRGMTLHELLERRRRAGSPLPDSVYQPLATRRGTGGHASLVDEARELLRSGGEVPLVREVFERALLWVSQPDDAPQLEAIVRDRALPVALRGAAAEVAGELGISPEKWLDPDDPDSLIIALAPIDQALRQLEAGEAEPWLSFYESLGSDERDALPELIRNGRTLGVLVTSLARALAPLPALEANSERRHRWIEALAAEGSAEAAEVLAHWRDSVPDRAARDEIRRALHRLSQRGVAVPERRSGFHQTAWLTSCDGSGGYSLAIRIEGPALGPVHLLYTLNLAGGLRDATRIASSSLDPRERIAAELPVTVVDVQVPEAVRRVRVAAERARALGRSLPTDFAETERWLRGIPTFTVVGEESPRSSAPQVGSQDTAGAEQLFTSDEYGSWFHVPLLSHLARELDDDSPEAALARAIDTETRRDELAQMLRHQQQVYQWAGRTGDAALCEEAAREIESGDWLTGVFGRCYLERSLEEADQRLDDEVPLLPPREDRAQLVSRLDPAARLTKRELLALDLAEVAFYELRLAADALPASERPGHAEWLELAEAIGRAAADQLARRSGRPRRRFLTDADLGALAQSAGRVFPKTGLSEAVRDEVISRALEALERFGSEVCELRCPHRCVDRLDDAAGALVFAGEHPAAASLAQEEDEGDPEELEGLVLGAMDALDALGVEDVDETLASLAEAAGTLSELPDETRERVTETLMDGLGALVQSLLVQRALALPEVPAGSDPGTALARTQFEGIFGSALSFDAFARLANVVTSSGPLMAALLRVRRPATIEDAQTRLDAIMLAWNHAPRHEFGGDTPDQRYAQGRS